MAGNRMRALINARKQPGSESNSPEELHGNGQVPGSEIQEDKLDDKQPFKYIPLDLIIADPDQPRKTFKEDKLDELVESIKARGILQPVRVIKIEDGKYMLEAGERRWRAAQKAGLKEIPAFIGDNGGKSDRLINGLVENILRDNLSAFEKAECIRKIQELNPTMSDTTLAKTIGISRMMLYRLMNIHKLPEIILDTFAKHRLNDRHAKALLNLSDYSQLQLELLEKIIEQSMSGPDAIKLSEEWLKDMNSNVTKTSISKYYDTIITTSNKIAERLLKISDEEEVLVKQQIKDMRKLLENLEYQINNRK